MKRYLLGLALLSLLVACAPEEKTALIETSIGNIRVKLYNSTPNHRDNFVKLVDEGYYDDLLIHRIIPNFMIQGGDPDSRTAGPDDRLGLGGPGYTLEAEMGAIHKRGALAAARLPDNMNPSRASSGSQFFIVQGQTLSDQDLDNVENQVRQMIQQPDFTISPEAREVYKTIGGAPFLDGQYTVFGEVTEGMEVVDQIISMQRDNNDRPLQDIVMKISME